MRVELRLFGTILVPLSSTISSSTNPSPHPHLLYPTIHLPPNQPPTKPIITFSSTTRQLFRQIQILPTTSKKHHFSPPLPSPSSPTPHIHPPPDENSRSPLTPLVEQLWPGRPPLPVQSTPTHTHTHSPHKPPPPPHVIKYHINQTVNPPETLSPPTKQPHPSHTPPRDTIPLHSRSTILLPHLHSMSQRRRHTVPFYPAYNSPLPAVHPPLPNYYSGDASTDARETTDSFPTISSPLLRTTIHFYPSQSGGAHEKTCSRSTIACKTGVRRRNLCQTKQTPTTSNVTSVSSL